MTEAETEKRWCKIWIGGHGDNELRCVERIAHCREMCCRAYLLPFGILVNSYRWAYRLDEPQPEIFEDDGKILTLTHGKFRLEELPGGWLLFQVLEMDERFRSADGRDTIFCCLGIGACVLSTHYPKILSAHEIYLRGRIPDRDLVPDVIESNGRPRVATALRDWSEHCPVFASKPMTDDEIMTKIKADHVVYGSLDGDCAVVELGER